MSSPALVDPSRLQAGRVVAAGGAAGLALVALAWWSVADGSVDELLVQLAVLGVLGPAVAAVVGWGIGLHRSPVDDPSWQAAVWRGLERSARWVGVAASLAFVEAIGLRALVAPGLEGAWVAVAATSSLGLVVFFAALGQRYVSVSGRPRVRSARAGLSGVLRRPVRLLVGLGVGQGAAAAGTLLLAAVVHGWWHPSNASGGSFAGLGRLEHVIDIWVVLVLLAVPMVSAVLGRRLARRGAVAGAVALVLTAVVVRLVTLEPGHGVVGTYAEELAVLLALATPVVTWMALVLADARRG